MIYFWWWLAGVVILFPALVWKVGRGRASDEASGVDPMFKSDGEAIQVAGIVALIWPWVFVYIIAAFWFGIAMRPIYWLHRKAMGR